MTPEEFTNKMDQLSHIEDKEYRHICMDQLILEILSELGYTEGCNIFKDTDKWYA